MDQYGLRQAGLGQAGFHHCSDQHGVPLNAQGRLRVVLGKKQQSQEHLGVSCQVLAFTAPSP